MIPHIDQYDQPLLSVSQTQKCYYVCYLFTVCLKKKINKQMYFVRVETMLNERRAIGSNILKLHTES